MAAGEWLALTLTCLAGAASPGPSLAMLIRSVAGVGVMAGLVFGICHGAGILIYAALVSAGLASVLLLSPGLFLVIQIAGLVFLGWVATGMLREGWAGAELKTSSPRSPDGLLRHGLDGFLIAFLNPKVAVFFTAIFSQFLTPGQSATVRIQMAATAWAVDSLWYMAVALVLGIPFILSGFRYHAARINLVMGAGLLLVALTLAYTLLAGTTLGKP